MKALITGGAGFIGSHLAEALLGGGHEVRVVDDLSTGSIHNIGPLTSHPLFDYTIGSVMDVPLMEELVDTCDVIFHLAAAVGVGLAEESSIQGIETNVDGTSVVLGLAGKKNTKLILASTSEVYGQSPDLPLREDADMFLSSTMKTRRSSAWSRAMAECLAMAHWHERHLPVVILRLFNTVGPRQTGRCGMVVPRFVQQALAGAPMTIYGDGEQSRCFAHVGDVARGMIDVATCPDAVGRTFNIGSDQEINIKGLALLVKDIAGSSSALAYVPYDQVYGGGFEDTQRQAPDLSKIRSLIGYRITKDLPATIRSVIEYQRAG